MDLKNTQSYPPDVHRKLPQSPEAERGIIGSVLRSAYECLDYVRPLITEAHFHLPANGIIFSVMCRMQDTGMPIDTSTVTIRLREIGKLAEIGGPSYLSDLWVDTPSIGTLNYYVKAVVASWKMREIIRHGCEYSARAFEEQEDADALMDGYTAGIMAISEKSDPDESIPVSDIVKAVMDRVGRTYEGKGRINGIPTGFIEYDRMTDGLQLKEVVVIGARPSIGKTALAMNIAENIAIDRKIPVGVFSIEMPKEQLVHRMVCGMAEVNWTKFRDGIVGKDDLRDIAKAASRVASAPIYFCDKSGIKINYLRAVARQWVRKYGVKVIFIDYLQLLKGSKNYKGDNRQGEVAEISSALKDIAKELDISIVVLAQLNRDVEKRQSTRGRPRASDLRESGSIEQDADVIALLHRQEHHAETDQEKEECEGQATLIIAKQRNGPVGDIPLVFEKQFTRFKNAA